MPRALVNGVSVPLKECRYGVNDAAGRLVHGKRDDERRPVSFATTFCSDSPAVQLHDVTDDAEPQSKAGLAVQPRLRLAEPVEDMRQERSRNADPGVLHRQRHVTIVTRQLHRDVS